MYCHFHYHSTAKHYSFPDIRRRMLNLLVNNFVNVLDDFLQSILEVNLHLNALGVDNDAQQIGYEFMPVDLKRFRSRWGNG